MISEEILEEYYRVGDTLSERFPGVDLGPIFELLTVKAELTPAPGLPEPVCDDLDDDKFVACALASKTKLIVSGDKHLLRVSGYHGLEVVRPRMFVDNYLQSKLRS